MLAAWAIGLAWRPIHEPLARRQWLSVAPLESASRKERDAIPPTVRSFAAACVVLMFLNTANRVIAAHQTWSHWLGW